MLREGDENRVKKYLTCRLPMPATKAANFQSTAFMVCETTSLKTRSGRYARMAFAMRSVTPDNTIGRLREICAFADGQMPATLTDGASTVGYLYGASTANLSDCLILEHA